jgi:phage host-nuclease inhibitor protein Gam
MSNNRKRFAAPALKSWEDVDLRLKEIGEIDLSIKGIEAIMNVAISDAKLAAEMDAKPLLDRKALLELEVKEYAEANKHEIEGKTKVLNFGKCGFRLSTKIILGKVAACLAALKARGMLDCITVKEEVNKEVLRTCPEEIIAAVGARKKVEDVFWLEPDYERLKA